MAAHRGNAATVALLMMLGVANGQGIANGQGTGFAHAAQPAAQPAAAAATPEFDLGVLSTHIQPRAGGGGFQLAGGAQASMRDINGGRMCVGAMGLEPPGYLLTGQIDLQTCGDMAREQPYVVGFRWGRHQANRDAYARYADRPETSGAYPAGVQVNLAELFPGDMPFECLIFSVNVSNGNRAEFVHTDLNTRFLVSSHQSPEAHVDEDTRNSNERQRIRSRRGRVPEPHELRSRGGLEVCLQRLTMVSFYDPDVDELWFCYMPDEKVPTCAAKQDDFKKQGVFWLVGALLIGAGLSYTLRNQAHFSIAASWVVRFLIAFESALVGLYIMHQTTIEPHTAKFSLMALTFTLACSQILMSPFDFCEAVGQVCPGVSTFYLFVLAFSPCFLCEWLAYYPAIQIIVDHRPDIIGVIAFGFDLIKHWCCLQYCRCGRDKRESMYPVVGQEMYVPSGQGAYAPMYQAGGKSGGRLAYAS